MTTYHEAFPLDCEFEIIQKFQHYIDGYAGDPTASLTLPITAEEQEWLDRVLSPEVSAKLGFEVHIILGMVSMAPPEKFTVLHVDADRIPRPDTDPNWALNIPLHNCGEGEMLWYTGDYEQVLEQSIEGVVWVGTKFNGEPEVVDSAYIDSPTLVRIDQPHRIHNQSEETRIMLSIRFTPDLKPKDY